MNYSALNPTIWAVFLGCVAVVWVTVRRYRAKHSGYPGRWPEDNG